MSVASCQCAGPAPLRCLSVANAGLAKPCLSRAYPGVALPMTHPAEIILKQPVAAWLF